MTKGKARRSLLVTRFRIWARRTGLSRKLAYALAAAAVLSGLATVTTMTSSRDNVLDPNVILSLLYLDAVLLLGLGAVVARRLTSVWQEHRRGKAGSGLHVRLVMLFSGVAVTPAILVAVFSALFMNFGVQAWFSERVHTALEASGKVANAYLREHRMNIHADALAMANDLNRDAAELMRNPRLFANVLTTQANVRSLPEALVIDRGGKVLGRAGLSLSLEFELVPDEALANADEGKTVILTNETDDRVRAVVKLDRFVDSYLLVGRFVDSRVLEHIDLTRRAVEQYQRLERSSREFQITFVMIFAVVAVLLLLAAVWLGLTLATRLAQPLSALIAAADRVGKGDLDVRVSASASADEIGALGRAFNRMTEQIETQQEGLLTANRELDERRRFTETVLAGVSAGVIGLDGEGRIHLPNRSASHLLETDMEAVLDHPLGEAVPEMKDFLAEAMARPERTVQQEIRITRNGRVKTLIVGIAAERLADEVIGYVVTFDDVTDLVSAQRTAAWADVARRIAHEIKNPLTPIQLSAERLRRKYEREIKSDPETFLACTDTIIRQVEDIGRMVDEFSSFARMPQAVLRSENLSELCRQTVFLERNRNRDIDLVADLPADDLRTGCDARQISRALTNLLKNAAESIKARERRGEAGYRGRIDLSVSAGDGVDGKVCIAVSDNGIGLPEEHRDRLTEPYVTTRGDGTGLGLAIVKKIVEDHDGELVLESVAEGGARVSLIFPKVSGAQTDGGNGDIGEPAPAAHGE